MKIPTLPETELAILVRTRMEELDLRRSEFTRIHNFDQALLSKILSSHTRSVNLETALKLAIGLKVPVREILIRIEKPELYKLLEWFATQDYAGEIAHTIPPTVPHNLDAPTGV